MILQVLLILLLCGLPATGAILHVPAEHSTIQGAVDAAANGDTIHVAPGTYYERLVIPDLSLTLCSDDFFTGDSAAINTTILDGEWLGTLIQVNTTGSNTFRIESFTLQRGMGQPQPSQSRGGVFQLYHFASLTARHIILRQNRSLGNFAILKSAPLNEDIGNVILEDIMLHMDVLEDSDLEAHTQFLANYAQSVVVRKFRHSTIDAPIRFFSIYADTMVLEDLQFHDQEVGGGCLGFQAKYSLSASNIHIWNCHSATPEIIALRTTDTNPLEPPRHLQLTNLTVESCSGLKPFGTPYSIAQVEVTSSGTVDINQVTIRECFTNTTKIALIHGDGWVRRVLVENNVAGADPGNTQSICDAGCFGEIVTLRRCSAEDVVVQGNTANIYPYTATNGLFMKSSGNGLSLILEASDIPHPITYRNITVQDNLVNDHEDNWDTRLPKKANTSRALAIGVGNMYGFGVLLENAIIRNNRQPNSIPERPNDDPELDERMVGSTVEFYPAVNQSNFLTMRNILIEDNDDGGLFTSEKFAKISVENVVSKNNARMGLAFRADSLILKNVLVSGTDSWEAHYTYPYSSLRPTYQNALELLAYDHNGAGFVDISNITLYDNNTECLLRILGMDSPNYQQFEIRNSILWNNNCEWFVNPIESINLFPPPEFRYSLLEEYQPGVGNLIGVDPWFDEDLGAPWLSPISPAIDAGDPNPDLNDREDPDNPGFALWPSQGTLRNDIGYTGGPQLFAIDTSWVALQRPKPRPTALPQGLTLHPAYPNPFNPTTTVSYTLTRPMQVELSVYNLLGQQVRTLAFGLQEAGEHSVLFKAGELASGVYVVELQAGGRSQTQKVLLLK